MTATAIRSSPPRCCAARCTCRRAGCSGSISTRCNELGAELSLAAYLSDVSDELRALAEKSPDTSPHRQGEPYRLAVTGIFARLAATAQRLNIDVRRPAVGQAEAYATAAELKADLDVLHRALVGDNSRAIARGRLRTLRGAVAAFGFHLATLDVRQNSAVHERTVAELFEATAPGTNYTQLSEEARVALLMRELETARPLVSPFLRLQRGDGRRARHLQGGRRGAQGVRRGRDLASASSR